MIDLLRPIARLGLRAVGHAFSLLSGFGTLASSRAFCWAADDDRLTATRLRDGSLVYVYLNDYVGRAAYFFGDLDPKLSWICRSALRAGDLMVDIGANYGVVAMLSAGLVGPSGSVHAFEPQPELASLLQRSSDANGYHNVHVHPFGLSDVDEQATMTVPPTNRGMGTVSLEVQGDQIRIPLRRASECLFSMLGEQRARLVKMDVEGHESHVFSGAASWIRRTQPEVFLFEHNGEDSLWQMPGLEALSREGYRFYGIPKAKLHMRLVPLVNGQETRPQFHDIVAVHPTADWHAPV